MSLTENSDQVFLPGGVQQNSKFEIWPLHYILCTISLAISYVSRLFCAHLRAVPNNFNCNNENRVLGK